MGLEAHVPVVPVVMVDTDAVMPIGRTIPRVGRVGVVIGEPLDAGKFAARHLQISRVLRAGGKPEDVLDGQKALTS